MVFEDEDHIEQFIDILSVEDYRKAWHIVNVFPEGRS